MEFIGTLDTQLFFLINHLPHPRIFDEFGLLLSGIGDGGIIWYVIGAYLIYNEEKKDHRKIYPIAIAALFTWILTELLLKPTVARLRPSSALDAAIIVGGFPLGFSFPSTHTTFAFALATVLSYLEPTWRMGLYILATLIGLSRIYLGHHYPVDVLVGGMLGWVIGTGVIWWYKKYKVSNAEAHSKRLGKKAKKKMHPRKY